ncbi:MAG: hypothetical protein K2N47_05315, partial [Clostridia bacterium]|nr:hypothetical protein [Clostridia bacterium]
GWYSGGEYVFDPPTSDDTVKIGLPSWKDGDEDDDGVLNMKNFKVSVENKTFLKAYKVGNADGTCTDEFTADIEHFGEIDYEKAVSVNANRVVYTTWRDGNWFHIRTANQLINNAYANGCYEIHKDLDFTDKTWPMAFAGEFSGRFVSGDGTVHTVSNLKARQNPGDYNVKRGGIFGEITAEAVIEKLDFVDAEYTCSGSRMQDAYFGLFAGYLDEDATLTDVTISGQLNISPTTLFYNNKVSVGVFSGNGVTLGVNTSNITCGLTTEIEPPYKYTLTNDGGKITVTYEFIGF